MLVFCWMGVGILIGSFMLLVGQVFMMMVGWELVGNYGDMIYDMSNLYNVVNLFGKFFSWWLISVYNLGFKQIMISGISIVIENCGVLDNGGDYFKFYVVVGIKCMSMVDNKGVCGGISIGKLFELVMLVLISVVLVGVVGLCCCKVKFIV